MLNRTAISSALAAVLVAVLTLAHAQETNSKADALKRPEVLRGQQAFATNCAACHGANATGGMGPNLTMSSLVRHDSGGTDIGKVIHEGRMDKGMPAFPQLTADQVSDIATFLHARIDASARASALGASAFNGNLNVGDPAAGKNYFQAKCASCHSATGDMKGIATKHDPAELESLLLMPKSGPATGTVTAAGKRFEGTFLENDPFTVILRTADGATHTWPTEQVKATENDPLKGHRALLPVYTDKDIHDVFAYLETLK